ncbi:MAG: phosphate acyltransferase [Candidatus Cloacimonetes bacterium]|nr:phosphate acyltransferase [Candidatus Cloacimonadota bacterium]
MKIVKLEELVDLAKQKSKKRLVVVYVNDQHTLDAVNDAVDAGLIEATLTGEKAVIEKMCLDSNFDINKFNIIEQSDPIEAGLLCCDFINQGRAQLIMKGSITTDDYMRCLLNKERGIMEPGSMLTHVTVIEHSEYPKLMIVGDVAVIPAPTLEQKEKILHFLIDTAHKLGNEEPLVALVAPSEKQTTKISSSADAMALVERAKNGFFGKSIIDGPMGFDLAIDKEAVTIKGYKSPVGGNADVVLFPNIESANVYYKTVTKFLHAEVGAMVVGAKVPAILSSRGDSAKTKLYSIALAAVTTDQ